MVKRRRRQEPQEYDYDKWAEHGYEALNELLDSTAKMRDAVEKGDFVSALVWYGIARDSYGVFNGVTGSDPEGAPYIRPVHTKAAELASDLLEAGADVLADRIRIGRVLPETQSVFNTAAYTFFDHLQMNN